MTDKKYTYFVSYMHRTGYGRIRITRGEKIDSIEAIDRIEKLLESDVGLEDVAIMNYILMNSQT